MCGFSLSYSLIKQFLFFSFCLKIPKIRKETWAYLLPLFIEKYRPYEEYRFNTALKFLDVKVYFGDPEGIRCWVNFIPDEANKTCKFAGENKAYKNTKIVQQFFESEKTSPDYLEYLYRRGKNTLPELDIDSDVETEIIIKQYW